MAGASMSLQEAADLLDVHYMTAYRYVRLGLLPATKEAGSWRVLSSDVAGFRDHAGSAGPGKADGRNTAPWSERLEARLVAGDARGAWGVVEAALAAGTDLQGVYLEVLSPAMASIGDRWAAGELDVATEHRARGIVHRLIGRLGPRFVRRGRTRGVVVLGTAAHERHALPLAVLGDLARSEGFEVSDLGADLPPESFAQAVAETDRLVLVGVSAMSPGNDANVRAALERIRAAVPGVPVVLGGYAVRDLDHARSLGADQWAGDGAGFLAVLESVVSGQAGGAHSPGDLAV